MATSSMSPASTGGGSTGQASAHKRPANLHDVGFAHGVIMLIAFGILFPLGGCLLRALHGRNVARIHAYWQSTAWALAIIGFGMGVYIAKEGGHGVWKARNGHKIIGLIVIIIMTLQPIIGIVHHLLFKKYERSTIYGLVHRILGRAALVMGAINIGLGLQLGRAGLERMVAYSVVTAFFFGAYFTVTALYGPEAKKCSMIVTYVNATPRDGSIDTTNTSNVEGDVEKDGSSMTARAI